MLPMADALIDLVQSGVVDVREAFRKSPDRDRLLAGLKRDVQNAIADESKENAVLRERINDVAAEVARLTATLKLRLAGLDGWREVDGDYAVAEFTAAQTRVRSVVSGPPSAGSSRR